VRNYHSYWHEPPQRSPVPGASENHASMLTVYPGGVVHTPLFPQYVTDLENPGGEKQAEMVSYAAGPGRLYAAGG
jgi:hypothetical protein